MFESFDNYQHYIGHSAGQGVLLHDDGTDTTLEQISWAIHEVPASEDVYDEKLEVGGTYGFLTSYGAHQYWQADSSIITVQTSNAMAHDTKFQFVVESGLAGPSTVSFRSVAYPDKYARHSNYHIWLHKGSGSIFNADASYFVR
mmetsp:Transcript_34263/g.25332  ORF Transcript_34263/g.25332 Transcript_34263/m.25332 type:complete len:144 (-) Transcript_34263:771-1202(-)